MRSEDYLNKRLQDAEYQALRKELEPLLDLSDDLLRERLKKGWTQSELARRAGTKQSNISRLEAGLSNPTYNFLKKIADALEVELKISLGNEKPTSEQKVIHYTANIMIYGIPQWSKNKKSSKKVEFELAQVN